MAQRIALFWPGDLRQRPNELAQPNAEDATLQLERALGRIGRQSYRIPGFLSKPHESIEKLGPIQDPMIGVCVHWFYGPHTTEGVVGKDTPLLLASNFSGQWPGLVGLLNTGACLESLSRPFSRIWTTASDWTHDEAFMTHLEAWCATGRIRYPEHDIAYDAAAGEGARAIARDVCQDFRRRRALILMLGDTSMGMINGYFGPRLLHKHGFAEHKIDQAWLPVRLKDVKPERVEEAFRFVREKGVTFHWRAQDAEDFTEDATRTQLR